MVIKGIILILIIVLQFAYIIKKSVGSSEIIKNVWNIIAISHSCIKIIYVYSLNIDSKLIILGFYKIAKNNNNG